MMSLRRAFGQLICLIPFPCLIDHLAKMKNWIEDKEKRKQAMKAKPEAELFKIIGRKKKNYEGV